MIQTRNLEQYAEIHRTRRYGDTGIHSLRVIEPWVALSKPKHVLDYGAGQSQMVFRLKSRGLETRHRYDPAIPDIATIPLPHYDLVTCTDVFEHLDESEIPAILKHIDQISDRAIFGIDTKVAGTILPNGENAHATVRRPEWWTEKLRERFPESELIRVRGTQVYIKTWRSGLAEKAMAWLLRHLQKVGGGV